MATEDEKSKEEGKKEAGKEEAAAPKKSKLKLIIIIAAAVLVMVVVVVFFITRKGGKEEASPETLTHEKPVEGEGKKPAGEGEAPKAKAEGEGTAPEGEATPAAPSLAMSATIFPLEHFIVNINNETGEVRYLKIEVTFEIQTESMKNELGEKTPKIRDSIITILTNKNINEISDANGKLKLKEEIRARVNSYLTSGKVKEVYFTDFIIQ